MNAKETYQNIKELYNANKFEEALKLTEELKKLVPNLPESYLLESLESLIYSAMYNTVKENAILRKNFPHFNLLDQTERILAAEVLYNLGVTNYRLAMPEEAVKNFCLSAQLASNDIDACKALSGAIFSAHYAENFSVQDFKVLYGKYKKSLMNINTYPHSELVFAHEKIRLGFLSSDFKRSVVMNWSIALLTELDKDLFEVYCYSRSKDSDEYTEGISQSVDVYRDISDLKEVEAAEVIHNDEIDILFDLDGHTRGGGTMRIMAYRPAPVQIFGIAYVSSTGLDYFDYFLSDKICAGNPDYFTEKLIILPRTHICYAPSRRPELASEPPCLAKGYVTFGCFNRFGKITDSMLRAWQRILAAVPDSRLILKTIFLNTEDGKNFACDRLKSFGIEVERVEFRPPSGDYLEQYRDVDIALDTFPYTGGVTTCEALYMGVPVVSLYGDRHGSRIGLSILTNIGLEGLAVSSYDSYVERVVALAGDWDLLSLLRKNLRGMMEKSPLMDYKLYIRDVEDAFIKILLDKRKEYA